MPLRSMTGFSQVKGQMNGQLSFSVSLKSVNHRFLDLHLRMPSGSDALEMKLRRLLKEKLARGHVELTLSLQRADGEGIALNRPLVRGYVEVFRQAAAEFSLPGEPDLNAVLRLPGALESAALPADEAVDQAIIAKVHEALASLNAMREDEGRQIER